MNRTLSRLIARSTEALLPERTVTLLRERREWKAWVASLDADVLAANPELNAEQKRALFRHHVKLVEIETHARCNRICSFCPNIAMDRRRNRTVTDVDLLSRVFTELGSIDYDRQIKVARYSEPLTNPHLHERIADARRLVPRAQLAVVTNTDYLTRAALERLRHAGLDVLYMSLYLKSKETWSLGLAREYNRQLAAKLGIQPSAEQKSAVGLVCFYQYEGMVLRSACMDFDRYGSDRGGTVPQYTDLGRTGPCREPFETFVIDYTGAVMPCCNLRSDIPSHLPFAVGDLSDPGQSIFDIYAGALAGWRRSMVGMGPKDTPCMTCRHREVAPELARAVGTVLHRRLRVLGHEDLDRPPADG